MEKFNSRETYLAYRAQWKSSYAQLSIDIRLQRKLFKESQRNFSLCETNSDILFENMGNMFYILKNLRCKANEMLTELSEAKIEAGKQMKIQ